ncbi:CD115 [Mytilus edulis]|uniref:CSF1R n=1 Tax=Mytilus edulis TaxID=6550 RepID=A0A8S3V0A6_MYTED|nr:CD115 [Mytilus edulis]
MASELACAPFAKVSISELLKILYSGEVPMQPDVCPDWLYDIMKLCWNRDRTRRPTTNHILQEISKNMEVMRNMESSKQEVNNHSDQEMYDVLEDSEPEGDYEPLNDTNSIDSENYDSLGDGSVENCSAIMRTKSSCPLITIPKVDKITLLLYVDHLPEVSNLVQILLLINQQKTIYSFHVLIATQNQNGVRLNIIVCKIIIKYQNLLEVHQKSK